MSAETTTKAEWLALMEQARRSWDELVVAAGAVGMEEPGATGAWSFKDVAGHLNGWRVRTVNRLEAAARGEAPPPPPWPAELSDETDEGLDAINGWLYEHYRARPTSEILIEAAEQFARLRAAVEAISEEDLTAPGRFPWLGGAPLSAVVEGSAEHLHEEHEPALRAWLSAQPR